jgi:phage gpG-like protein
MLKIEIEVIGDKEFIGKLKKFGKEVLDWTPEFQTMEKHFKKYLTDLVFEYEGAIFGYPWPKLSPKYELKKRVEFSGKGILERTGDLRKGWRFEASKGGLLMENNVPYGVYHQSTKPRKKIPRRPLLRIDSTQEKYIVDVLKKGLLERMKRVI